MAMMKGTRSSNMEATTCPFAGFQSHGMRFTDSTEHCIKKRGTYESTSCPAISHRLQCCFFVPLDNIHNLGEGNRLRTAHDRCHRPWHTITLLQRTVLNHSFVHPLHEPSEFLLELLFCACLPDSRPSHSATRPPRLPRFARLCVKNRENQLYRRVPNGICG